MEIKRIILLGLLAAIGLWWFSALSFTIATPHVTYLQWFPPWETAFMEQDGSDDIARRWVSLSRISKLLQQAVILAEDDQFFEHQGIDVEALKRAARINWKKRTYKRGASTITMQLARNLYLSPEKTLFRKGRELLIAFKLERELSKTRILELYLNVVEWGDGIYGAEAAARHYFHMSAADLDRHQAAFLAAILPRPKFYDHHRGGPFLNRRIASIENRL